MAARAEIKYDVWAGFDGQLFRFTPQPVDNPVNPIGCGDCLAVGIGWALDQGYDVPSAVEQVMACAQANLRTLIPSDFDGERELRSLR